MLSHQAAPRVIRVSVLVPVLAFLAMTYVVLVAPRVGCSGLMGTDPWDQMRTDPVSRLGCVEQFDGHEYLAISERGYWYAPQEQSPVVWFPLYPLAIRAAGLLVAEPLLAAVGVSLWAGLVSVVLLWRWLALKLPTWRARAMALAVFMLYPYGWYLYGVVYADALFLAFVLLAFSLVERRSLVLAGVAGALATACRPTGLALVPALVLLGLQRDGVLWLDREATGVVRRFALPLRVDRSRLRPRSFGPALSLLGVGSYLGYLWVRFGAPLAFSTNESTFRPGDLPVTKSALINSILEPTADPVVTATLVAQAAIALGALWLVPAVCRRFGAAYGLFVALLVAMPTVSSADYMGTGRYLMCAFPLAALIGERLAEVWPERSWPAVAWMAVSAAGMLVLSTLFAAGYYVA